MTAKVTDADERQRIISVCTEYLGEEWSIYDVTCDRILTGIANKTYRCTLNCEIGENKDVIVRFYGSGISGDENQLKFKGEAAEVIVMDRLHDIGMAPKILAVFDGGRIEEYIPSKTATEEDLNSVEVCKAVIRKLAKYHSLSMPLSKNPNSIIDHFTKMTKRVKITEALFENVSEVEVNNRRKLFSFPFETEYEWIRKVLPKIGHKAVFCHNDLNPNNILMKTDANSIDDKIMLIDYEGCAYFYRGYDITSFMRMKASKLRMESDGFKIDYIETFDNSTRNEIIIEYLNEKKRLNENDFDDKFDTLERLIMELDFIYLFYDIVAVGMFQWMVCESKIKVPLEMTVQMIATYEQRKQDTLANYGDPLDWD